MEVGRSRKRVQHPAALAAIGLLAAGLLASSTTQAKMQTFVVDPEHTAVTFKVRHFFSKVPGQFKTFEGTIHVDRQDWSKSSVNFSIDATTIDTNEPARDKHLRSDAFFDVENHPTITFQSTAVRAISDEELKIDGNLTIRGITKPVTLDVDVLGFGEFYGVERAAFEARTKIDRDDFKVSWNDVVEGGGVVLGKDVDIVINLEAKLQKKK